MADDLEDSIIQHQFYLIQLGNFYGKKIDPVLKSIRDYISARLLSEGDNIPSQKVLADVNRDIKAKTTKEFGKFIKDVEDSIPIIAAQEADFYPNAVESAIIEGVEIKKPDPKKIASAALLTTMMIGSKGAGVTLKNVINSYNQRESNRVISRVNSGFTQGESTATIAKAINGTKGNGFKDGMLNISRNNAFSMTNTQMPQIASISKTQTDKLNSSVIIGYRLVAVLDKNTTDICKGWDGTEIIYKKTTERPSPPFHPRCRTTKTTITADGYNASTNNTRLAAGASGVENVSEKTTYYNWLKRQPADFQDDALGKTKGKIFRNAGLTTEQFKRASVTQTGQSLNLEQMARKNKKINSYLNK